MADLTIPKDDYGYNLALTFVDSGGTAVDLGDYDTVTLKVWKAGSSASPKVDHACDVTVAASGTCTYTIHEGDFDVRADYKLKLVGTATGVIAASKTYDLLVEGSA